ncbi:MAG: ParB/Srx family N-terminal domain-containing protein [Hyphomonadaceae bacterium]|nr:ParB/Srx family N-terminal domain-containing protein [Hyphomonadaceae bacterium]
MTLRGLKKQKSGARELALPDMSAGNGANGFSIPAAGLNFAMVPITRLSLMERRVRHHPPRQIEQICASMLEFGWVMPLLVTSDGRVIAGEARLEAANVLELTHAPVVRVDNLTEAQIKAYRLADNRLAERAVWDDAGLRAELQEIVILAPDLDISAMGYEIPEFDEAIGLAPGVGRQGRCGRGGSQECHRASGRPL